MTSTAALTTTTTMRPIVRDRHGPADVPLRLDRGDRPQIAEEEVRVQVRAAVLHRGTSHMMAGQPYLLRLLGVLGDC